MIGIPLWAGGTMHDFIEVQRIPLKLNTLSEVIMFLYMVYTQYFIFLIAAIAVTYVFREKIWDNIRTLPVFSFINDRMKISRGLDFVTSYQLLLGSGFNNLQSFRFLAVRSKGSVIAFTEAAERLTEVDSSLMFLTVRNGPRLSIRTCRDSKSRARVVVT